MVVLEKLEKEFIVEYKKQCEKDLISLIDMKKSNYKGIPDPLVKQFKANSEKRERDLEFIINIFDKLINEFKSED